MSFAFTQGVFVFCLVWSVGASCDDTGRVKFDAVVREVLNGPLSEETRACHGILATAEAPTKQLTVPLPTEGMVYQYRFIKEVGLLLITVQLRALYCFPLLGLMSHKHCEICDFFMSCLWKKLGEILAMVYILGVKNSTIVIVVVILCNDGENKTQERASSYILHQTPVDWT